MSNEIKYEQCLSCENSCDKDFILWKYIFLLKISIFLIKKYRLRWYKCYNIFISINVFDLLYSNKFICNIFFGI